MQIINPATEAILGEYYEHSEEQVSWFLDLVQEGYQQWSVQTMQERGKCMLKLASLLREHQEHCARLITLEMGKPIKQSRAEIEKCAQGCEYYASYSEKLLAPHANPSQKGIITFEPLGIILGIMPWNFPFWQVLRFAVPTLMAGNGILLKHAPNVPGCAKALESLVEAAGFPRHLLKVLFISNEHVEKVIEDKRVKGVALTGSDRAGTSVGAIAGKALKKSVLELGGSDPFLVFDDVDIEACAEAAVNARLQNCGQSCIAAKRFIVVETCYEHFCDEVLKRVKKINIGDPLIEETELGPLAREDLLKNLERQVQVSLKQGCSLLHGGKRLEGKGFFYEPAILDNISKDMPVYREETFGPVFVMLSVKDAEEAIALANDSPYGLGASIWTRNEALAKHIAKKLEAGIVCINTKTVSNIQLPFGGVKRSGYGRELSQFGITEFVNIKTIMSN